jgi:hypothetical protein
MDETWVEVEFYIESDFGTMVKTTESVVKYMNRTGDQPAYIHIYIQIYICR